MIHRSSRRGAQRGVITLFLALVMLLLITAMVMTAFTLGATNLRAVGNLQVHAEALAAAQMILEAEIGRAFHLTPRARSGLEVDIDDDGTADYQLDLAAPECVIALPASPGASSSVTLPEMSSFPAWNTTWELVATVTDPRSGAVFGVVHGVRVLLSEAEKNLSCT